MPGLGPPVCVGPFGGFLTIGCVSDRLRTGWSQAEKKDLDFSKSLFLIVIWLPDLGSNQGPTD